MPNFLSFLQLLFCFFVIILNHPIAVLFWFEMSLPQAVKQKVANYIRFWFATSNKTCFKQVLRLQNSCFALKGCFVELGGGVGDALI